jgi:hypothetical protein
VGIAPPAGNPPPLEYVPQSAYDGYAATDPHGASTGFINPALDSILRVHYHTQSYGQEAGNFGIGTFKAFTLDMDAIAFFDGQVILNDEQGVGYDIGWGYRWLSETTFSYDAERITGLSIWTDGTGTSSDHFFAQVGVSYESLGDRWDFRVNGYMPVSNRFMTGEPVEAEAVSLNSNSLSPQLVELPGTDTLVSSLDTAFFGSEAELARRLGNRDAWGLAGIYVLNSGRDDTAGFRLGLRGYAHPDVLVSLVVSDDDIFNTNVTFGLTWFIGRTRTNYTPTASVLDRVREPVMRNDYVIIHHQE